VVTYGKCSSDSGTSVIVSIGIGDELHHYLSSPDNGWRSGHTFKALNVAFVMLSVIVSARRVAMTATASTSTSFVTSGPVWNLARSGLL
jgi:hypothetical protein